ncbi:MAG: decaprenyl-phosphate phosphoribosyltransferase [Kiritimatiellaeota bacterium]|nr:decaprenyl-phosphate phosphoribosyltransferase [Kiritimatiellota bacterium]
MTASQPFPLLRALRIKQWTKNLIIFAAFIFALGDRQQQVDWRLFGTVFQAMLAFCLISSGVYLINDARDLELDRVHPVKQRRPMAAGELGVPPALVLAAALLVAGLVWSGWLARDLLWITGGYVVMQLAYSLGLKRVAMVDLFVIAAGFVLRALAGAVAIHVAISHWLLLCAMLLALFLALCKRRHEKVVLGRLSMAPTRPSLLQYDERVLDQLIAIVSSATLVCYALYTLWPDTVAKFGTDRLVLTVPFVIFGLFRYLDLVYRHERGDRPEQILLTDLPLLVDLALYGLTVLVLLMVARQ